MKKDKTKTALKRAYDEYVRRQKTLKYTCNPTVWNSRWPKKNTLTADEKKSIIGYWINEEYWLAPWEYQECCWAIQDFTNRKVLWRHAKSVQHIAKRCNVFQSHLRKRIVAEKVFRVIVKNVDKR